MNGETGPHQGPEVRHRHERVSRGAEPQGLGIEDSRQAAPRAGARPPEMLRHKQAARFPARRPCSIKLPWASVAIWVAVHCRTAPFTEIRVPPDLRSEHLRTPANVARSSF